MTEIKDQDPLEAAALWFFRQDGKTLSFDEQKQFESWLAASEQNRLAYAEISGTWRDLGVVGTLATNTIVPPMEMARRRYHAPVAAALAFFMIVAGSAYVLDVPTRLQADDYTSVGELRTVTFSDGSIAEMNGDTAIALAYSETQRRVRLLKGEATFTVAHDESRPFVVEAEGGDATALGTVYNVRTESAGVAVTVLESHVAVAGTIGAAPVRLGPDQRVYYRDGRLGPVEDVDSSSTTAWRRGKLIFVDEQLGDVIAELNRYHKGVIRIVDNSIRTRRVSGVFETGDIVKTVEALEKSFGFRDTRLSGYVILIHR